MKKKRKEREKLLRKNDILNASEKVFAKKGFHKATMNDIAKESQYAVGTIYLYFKNKNDLYFTLMRSKFESMILSVKQEVEKVAPKDKIKTLIECQLRSFEKDKDFFKIFLSEVRSVKNITQPKFTKEHLDAFIKHIEFISSVIEQSRKKGLIRKDINSLKAAYLTAAMINASIFYWINNEKNNKAFDLNDQVDFVYNVLLNGIGK